MENIVDMYIDCKMSIVEIHAVTKIPKSTIRYYLKKIGVLRSRTEGILLAKEKNKLGSGLRGKTRIFTDDHKKNISKGKLKHGEKYAVGISLKQNGYYEYTRGEHKGRLVHVVEIEKLIGRRLFSNEVVHHKDENKLNNNIENLQLMTRSDHAKHHGDINFKFRKRNEYGEFK